MDIQPNGEWKAHRPVEDDPDPEPKRDAFEVDDDDLVEVVSGHRNSNAHNVAPALGVPTPSSGASREGSSMPRSGGTKRSLDVIDLTLSDDDDETSQPPQKRPQYGRPSAAAYPY